MLIPFDYLFRKYQIKAKNVLHIGASTGQEAEAYARQRMKNVVWIEALPSVHKRLLEHLKSKDTPTNHIAFCACVSNEDGKTVTFNESSNDGQSSSFLELGTHKKHHPNVRYVRQHQMTTTRVDTLLKGPYLNEWLPMGSFLNIDLQGAELLALKGMGDLIHRFDYAYVEVNTEPLYEGCALIGDIDKFLAEFGLMRLETKMTNWQWGDAFYSKR